MAEAEREQRPLLEVEQSGRDPAVRYDHGASTTSASLGSEDEDVLQSAILAGFTTEETSHYINDRNLVTQVCSQEDLSENDWIQVGYRKKNRWGNSDHSLL